jgi:hypothetical protein
VLFTVATGGATYLVTSFSRQDPTWTVTLSVLTGGVALIIQFLADFERRLTDVQAHQTEHADRVERLVEEKFATINEATELFGLVEESALQTDVVTQLVRHATALTPASPALINQFAHGELRRMSDFLKELGEGSEVIYDGEDRDWLLGLTRSANTRIDATSLATVDAGGGLGQGSLWITDLGKRYLDAQGEAIKEHGVVIRRLFILDGASAEGPGEWVRLCQQQESVGVEVRVLDPAAVPESLQTSLFDFVLFDNVLSYEVSTGSWARDNQAPIIVNTRLVLHEGRVANRVQNFQRLWAAGGTIEELTARG